MKKLVSHSWPGNVRELQHAIEKAVILSENWELTPDDFLFNGKSNAGTETNSLNLEENEKQLISRAIEQYRGNLSQAARSLGINRSTLYEKINGMGYRRFAIVLVILQLLLALTLFTLMWTILGTHMVITSIKPALYLPSLR